LRRAGPAEAKTDHDIESSQIELRCPKRLSDPAFALVARDGTSNRLTPDYDAEASEAKIVGSRKHLYSWPSGDCRRAQ
jgi:hypothetical protein